MDDRKTDGGPVRTVDEGELAEQRHQLLDLDADSVCRDFPGAVCVMAAR